MGKPDAVAADIVAALRAAGATVRYIVGEYGQSGIPDLLVGYDGITYLMEIKSKGGSLSKAQKTFWSTWRGGPLVEIRTIPAALASIGIDIEEGRL
jgi:hypothetical protein